MKAMSFKEDLIGRGIRSWSLLIGLSAILIVSGFFISRAVALTGINLVTPNGGEYWSGTQEVTWTANCEAGDFVNIQYTTGGTYTSVATVSCSPETYNWVTDTGAYPDNSNYQVRVYLEGDLNKNDISDSAFTIDNTDPAVGAGTITSPNGGEIMAGGSSQTITWNPGDITDVNLDDNPITLEYYDGTDWQLIAENELNDGSYDWATVPSLDITNAKVRIVATDKAGNTALDESSEFVIDSTNPTASVTVLIDPINDFDLEQTITIVYSETMNDTVNPLVEINELSNPYTAVGGIWSMTNVLNDTYTVTQTINDDGEERTATINVSAAEDLAGNAQEAAGTTFEVDTKNPTIISAMAEPALAKAGEVTITVTFSENMDPNSPLDVQVNGLADPISVSKVGYSDNVWTGLFILEDHDELTPATISVIGGHDVIGNDAIGNPSAGSFGVDTISPSVSSIVPDIGLITDEVSTFKIAISYDETMNELSVPVIVFDPEISSTLVFSHGEWTDIDIYTATYTVSDANEEIADVDITVTGAEDLAGNTQQVGSLSDAFEVDTKNPAATIEVGTSIVSDNDLIQEVTVNYDEIMLADPEPDISFGDGLWVSNGDGGWDVSGMVWTESFTLDDANEEIADVDITVTGAEDLAGNTQQVGSLSDAFEVDTKNPTVLSVSPTSLTDTSVGAVEVVIEFDEIMKDVINPTVTISGLLSPYTLSGGWLDDDTWVGTFDLNDDEEEATGTYNISGAEDAAGNLMVPDSSNTVIVDTITPDAVTIIIDNDNVVTKDSTPELSLTPGTVVPDYMRFSCNNSLWTEWTPWAMTYDSFDINGVNCPGEGVTTVYVSVKDSNDNIQETTNSDAVIYDSDNTLTVAATGADFTSIQEAINAATAGDVIDVAAGSYDEDVVINKDITVQGDGKENTTITRSVKIDADGVTLTEFKIIPGPVAGEVAGVYLQGDLADVVVDDNEIDGSGVGGNPRGVLLTSGTNFDNVLIDNNEIHDCTTGIYTNPHTGIVNIENNEIYNTVAGIGGLMGANVRHNVFHDNDEAIGADSSIVGSTYVVELNKFLGNIVKNYDAGVTIIAERNWWGSNQKSNIETMISGDVDFDPWYLDEEMTTLSNTDIIGPLIVLTNDIGDRTIVKESDIVEITATFSDDNGLDTGVTPTITINNGEVDGSPMASSSPNIWTYSWNVPTGDKTVDITVSAQDIVGNDAQLPTGITEYTIDNTIPALSEVIPVPTPTNNPAPSYTFNSSESGEITYGGSCSSATIEAVAGDNTITFNPLSEGIHDDCTITVTDEAGNTSDILNVNTFTIDTVIPVLSEITPVPTPTNNPAPSYTFNSSESGEITYGGSCSSATSNADVGDNLIILDELEDGIYNDCTIIVTDESENESTVLTISEFVIDIIAPEIINLTPAHTSVTSDATPVISANFIENGSGIDIGSIEIKVNGENKTDYAVKTVDGVTYTPVVPLVAGTYEVIVKVSDLTGNQADDASWSFIVNPSVTTISVSSNKVSLVADGLSQVVITAQVLDSGSPVENAVVNFATTIGTLSDITTSDADGRATAVLTSNTAGQAVVTASHNSNNGLIQGTANVTFTEVVTDTTAPTATQYPADNSIDVSVDVYPYIDFSEAMDEVTLTSENIELRRYSDNSEVATTISIDNEGTRVTFIPDDDLGYDTQYYFFVGAGVKDLAGNSLDPTWTSTNKSSHEFSTTIEDVPVTSYEISLNEGWNLISLPLIPDNDSIEVILEGIEENVDVVKYYENGAWLSYVPGIVESLETMEDGKGYWINMLEADALTVVGKEMPGPADALPSYPVDEGWNLIGFKSVSPMKGSAYLSGVDYVTLYGYDDEYTTIVHPELGIDKDMIPGNGYWLYANSNDDIVPVLAD